MAVAFSFFALSLCRACVKKRRRKWKRADNQRFVCKSDGSDRRTRKWLQQRLQHGALQVTAETDYKQLQFIILFSFIFSFIALCLQIPARARAPPPLSPRGSSTHCLCPWHPPPHAAETASAAAFAVADIASTPVAADDDVGCCCCCRRPPGEAGCRRRRLQLLHPAAVGAQIVQSGPEGSHSQLLLVVVEEMEIEEEEGEVVVVVMMQLGVEEEVGWTGRLKVEGNVLARRRKRCSVKMKSEHPKT